MTERDVFYLMELLEEYSYLWQRIGLYLGFVPLEITAMYSHYTSRYHIMYDGESSESCLHHLLTQWVQWPTREHPNRPTLEALCSSLRMAGQRWLAERVDMKMKQYKGKITR